MEPAAIRPPRPRSPSSDNRSDAADLPIYRMTIRIGTSIHAADLDCPARARSKQTGLRHGAVVSAVSPEALTNGFQAGRPQLIVVSIGPMTVRLDPSAFITHKLALLSEEPDGR